MSRPSIRTTHSRQATVKTTHSRQATVKTQNHKKTKRQATLYDAVAGA